MDIGIALFTYCRPIHTKRVLESLKDNNFTKVYIFQDGLKSETDTSQWEEVNRLIMDYAEKAEIHVSKSNKGLANSIVDGLNYVFQHHECAIALEDDMILGRGYDVFMRQCFEKYKNTSEVSCIAGGGWPAEISEGYPYDVFFTYRSSSAAWGTWRNRWEKYNRDFQTVRKIWTDPELRERLIKSGNDLRQIINAQLWGECDSWAVFWSLLQIESKGVCVLPVRYLAQDIGHDGVHGTNSVARTSRYDTELYNWDPKKELKFPTHIFLDEAINQQIKMILDISDSSHRNECMQRLYKKWVCFHQTGSDVGGVLRKSDVETIYIYGDGEAAEILLNELQEKIKVKGIIVLDKKRDFYKNIPVFEIRDNVLQSQDIVIVTPIHDIEYIRFSLKNTGCKVISLEAILNKGDNLIET